MIAALDVQYGPDVAAAAYVTFDAWTDPFPTTEHSAIIHGVEDYTPGEFRRRELPCLLAALRQLPAPPNLVVIDGYVWLDSEGRRGLGSFLFEALGEAIPVIGVAKTAFLGSTHAIAVVRGASLRPIFVTSAGIPADEAAKLVHSMHGAHRLPTLLKRVDTVCRQALDATFCSQL